MRIGLEISLVLVREFAPDANEVLALEREVLAEVGDGLHFRLLWIGLSTSGIQAFLEYLERLARCMSMEAPCQWILFCV